MKVAVIFHRLGPYHVARLEAASRSGGIVGIELGSHTADYDWAKVSAPPSFERITLFAESDSHSRPFGELQLRMAQALSQIKPDVVAIPGWAEKGALVALRWCLDNAVPAILMSESTANDEPRVSWKEFVKRRIIALCSSALVGGKLHKDYLSDLGMPRENTFTGYDAVDNKYFARSVSEVRARKSEVRKEHGLPDNYFLASARFIPKKNLSLLIRAYAGYRRRHVEARKAEVEVWSLVILGNGPLKSDLRSLISDLGLQDSVRLPGFKQYDELPVYYGMANAFVHASQVEQWGLVVNEAIASELPVIVSNRCGCAPELVQDGASGFLFDPNNEEELASHLLTMANLSAKDRAAMGAVSQEIAKQFDVTIFGEGIRNAAKCALAQGTRKLSLFDRMLLWATLRFRQ